MSEVVAGIEGNPEQTGMSEDESSHADGPVAYPIDGVLDLHGFKPADVKDLVPHYLEECHKRGILRVRIIHGKGIGNLRRSVHALLDRNPMVASYAQAGTEFGHWGATIVQLRKDL